MPEVLTVNLTETILRLMIILGQKTTEERF